METGLFQNGGRLATLAKSAGYDAEKLAMLCGSSPRHFRRIFRERYGHSPRQWLNNLKLVKAQNLLLANKPVKEVAFELGYKRPAAFSYWFRQSAGMWPTEYITGKVLQVTR